MRSRSLIRRRLKRNGFSMKFIIILFVIALTFISVGYSYLLESFTIEGQGNLVKLEPEFSGDYDATYALDTWYSSSMFFYNYNLTIKNLTDRAVNGWTVEIELPDESESVTSWNADITQNGNTFIFKNKSYNATLNPNGELTFGFQFQSPVTDEWLAEYVTINGLRIKISNLPEGYEPPTPTPTPTPTTDPDNPNPTPTPTPTPTPKPPSVEISISQKSSWPSGNGGTVKQYSYTINNISNKSIKSWKFKMSKAADATIAGAWNMNYVETDNYVMFSNGTWNGTIDAGKSLTLEFQLETHSNFNPTIYDIETK